MLRDADIAANNYDRLMLFVYISEGWTVKSLNVRDLNVLVREQPVERGDQLAIKLVKGDVIVCLDDDVSILSDSDDDGSDDDVSDYGGSDDDGSDGSDDDCDRSDVCCGDVSTVSSQAAVVDDGTVDGGSNN
eukprot:GHVS01031494.1.p1 GENE.GHVS01031494.1~~GHVS01031494.1.p1  ORF type:complete len:132 (+),score=40.97 GHVS01031494.1:541-936(+)